MNNATYSDLQVADRESVSPGKEASYIHPDQSKTPIQGTSRKRICGLTVPVFWIICAVIGVIIVGAVVGGVVGSSSKNNTSSKAAPSIEASSSNTNQPTPASSATDSTSSNTITSSASLTTSVTLTTTSVIGPSTTLLSDCPSSNNTIYQIDSAYFRKFCSNDLQSNGENAVDVPTESLDDCIALCNAYNIQNGSEIEAGSSILCNAVCWRATIAGDDLPGQCFGFTTQNSSNSFVFKGDRNCDSAAWINQSF